MMRRRSIPLTPRAFEEKSEARLAYRVRYLPQQIAATRRKLRNLEAEAERLGMMDLLPGRMNRIERARRQAAVAEAYKSFPTRQVAAMFGLSKSRVKEIAKLYGVSRPIGRPGA
jgi:hypothetical protein